MRRETRQKTKDKRQKAKRRWGGPVSKREYLRRLFLGRDHEARRQAAAVERLLRHYSRNFRMIVVLAEMAQNQGRGGGIELVAQVIAHHFVGQVAVAAHDALLHRPGIGSDLQHVEVVIGFEQQHVRAAQMELDRVRDISEIGDDADLDALRLKAKAYRVDGIMRNGEAVDFDVADGQARARLKALQARGTAFPIDQRRREATDVNHGSDFLREPRQAADVIRVLVRDQDGVDAVGLLANGCQALRELLETEAGVDQDAGLLGRDQRAVSGTAAREHAKFYDDDVPRTLPCNRKPREQSRDSNGRTVILVIHESRPHSSTRPGRGAGL